MIVPSEQDEQICLFKIIEKQINVYPMLAMAFHPANGGKRTKAESGIFKAMGVRKGVPDVLMPAAAPGPRDDPMNYRGLAIELKRRDGRPSDITAEQSWWLHTLHSQGWLALGCAGAEVAWNWMQWYVKGCPRIKPSKEGVLWDAG